MSGYIGTAPVPQSVQRRESFTATASQTSFATIGYTPQFLDVFLNGIHLLGDGVDYTASNSSDVVLTAGAASGDVLEVISYEPFGVADQSFTGVTTVTEASATPLVANRQVDDGSVLDIQKDGVSVGGISAHGGGTNLGIGSGDVGLRFTGGSDAIFPFNTVSNSGRDGAIDLGLSDNRFKDAYLSGGVYLGGTGAANKLDDYEEGTFTPSLPNGATYTTQTGTYTKIGDVCHIDLVLGWSANASDSDMYVDGLPFTALGATAFSVFNNGCTAFGDQKINPETGGTKVYLRKSDNTTGASGASALGLNDATAALRICGTYKTN